MNVFSGVSVATLVLVGWVLPAAAQSDPVQQLLATRACQGCNFSNVDFSGQDLSGVDLQGANLSNANLRGANLSRANLSGSLLRWANLSSATLISANLSQVNLTSANLETAIFSGANLSNANLSFTKAGQVDLSQAQLSGANLSDADFSDADLSNTSLTQATLNSTNLSHANLSGSDLTQASLLGTNLDGANLAAAQLTGTTLENSNLAQSPINNPEERVVAQANPVQQLLTTRACPGCDLSNADFSGQDLMGVDLQGANLSNVNFRGANLSQAKLSGSQLYLANLNGATLISTDLSNTSLKGTNLETAIFSRANLTKADLSYAKLGQADLSQAQLVEANLSDADLSGADLSNASLTDSKLNSANLSGANLSGSDLSRASLLGANLEGANLSSAQLIGANLVGSNLAQATIDNAEFANANLSNTILADAGLTGSETQVIGSPDSASTDSSDKEGLPSPLRTQSFQQPTADTLPQGTFVGKVTARVLPLPSGGGSSSDTPVSPFFGFSFGITDDLEVSAAYQQVDSFGPGVQGPFRVNRGGVDPGNDELTLQLKQKIWENKDETLALSGVAALSFSPTERQQTFDAPGISIRQENNSVVPGLQFPFTATLDKRTKLTLSPTVAFFPDSNALHLSAAPGAPGSFGTTFGITGAASFNVAPWLTLWADAFVPFTGNNSVSVTTGSPNQEIAFNAGARFLLTPRFALDIFATNAAGGLGPLALTTQPDTLGVGASLSFLPEIFASNRKIADNHEGDLSQPDSPYTVDGLGFFDGGTVPKGKFAFNLQGGSGGIQTALRYGVLKNFEAGIFLDYSGSNVDESLQGVSAKYRFLNQDKQAPVTISAVATLGQTNSVFTNFVNNDTTAFNGLGIDRDFPTVLGRDNGNRLFIATASLPIHYKISEHANIWFTPILGFVQTQGLEIGGFNLGGEVEVIPDLSLVAEVGANLVGAGNTFIGGRLADRIPWNFAVRLDTSRLFGGDPEAPRGSSPYLEVFVTNRLGSAVWDQLRVRDQNDIAIGGGIQFPF